MNVENKANIMAWGAWIWFLIQILLYIAVCSNSIELGTEHKTLEYVVAGVIVLLLTLYRAYRRAKALMRTIWPKKVAEAKARRAERRLVKILKKSK